ncbi:IclR family transcriptional regulator [Pseudoduganella umbonata]|uniref:IclR family transcriptional regulator n=1 Tax=Pseudoduganella umbonata TaxID=864828 RepID=A0A4V1ECX9_9BURK|nr:IclR family transcriptional regulator C-terminal domain-containing protein [Pseudoduganella umbonata]MBB3221628.1 DNA-binding IclR family transcriptional regulator [Pseudoduganella umbonata]QCP09141.1 IclR family transcriptional regulator [Pseudoduganella umbonata]
MDQRTPDVRPQRVPENHRTVDRVTRILEEVVYNPGMTFAELVRALDAPKSSIHGFLSGLLAKGWLYEVNHRYYLGPAVYGLTLASGHVRAGLVTHSDLVKLHEETGLAVFLGVQAGDHLIYIAEAGSDAIAGFEARTNIRRTLLATAGGKSLLAARSIVERESYLRRRSADESELVNTFLQEFDEIMRTGLATNTGLRSPRFAVAASVRNQNGEAVASITLVGPAADMKERVPQLGEILLRHVDSWSHRTMAPREAI